MMEQLFAQHTHRGWLRRQPLPYVGFMLFYIQIGTVTAAARASNRVSAFLPFPFS